MKLITVIIPVYGVEQYIAETVQSVLAQTYDRFELLIVDDGSVDRSVDICRRFTDPRITILSQKNGGTSTARNLGIRHATGEYIAFLDGDDRWLPDKLEKHVAHLDQSPEVGVSFCRSALIDEAGNPLGIYQAITKLQDITLLDLLCRTPIGNGSVPVIRKAVFDSIRYTNPEGEIAQDCFFSPSQSLHPSEDVECWVRIALTTPWKIEGIAEALTLYRVNSKGSSANLSKKLQSWEYMLSEIRQYAEDQIKPCEAPAMAYQYRHLARRAVSLRAGAIATKLIHQALKTYPQILSEEFSRTLQTLVAAYLLRLLPAYFYRQFEALAMYVSGSTQKQQVSGKTV